jgi:hypothetical protein
VWYNAVVSGSSTLPQIECGNSFTIIINYLGKVSVGSNSNILESSVVTALDASAVSIGSNVVIEQVSCCSQRAE